MGWILGALITLLCIGLSYITTCGLIWLITICFGWTFSWLLATGVWLLMIILRSIFKK